MPDYFNELYSGLKQTFEREAHCMIDEASDLDIRFRVLSAEFASIYEKMDFYERQIYPNTAVGDYLKRHGAVRGVIRKGSTRSNGYVTFARKLPAYNATFIPQGTLLTSSKVSEAQFRTTVDHTIPANTAVGIIPVESTSRGEQSAIAAGYIDVLVVPISGIISVTNVDKISGGSDSESDDLFKQRVIDSYSKINNGVNLNFYEQFAKSQPDIWYANAVYHPTIINRVNLYVENYERNISTAAIAQLQTAVGSARELGITVNVSRAIHKTVDVSIRVLVDNMANQTTYYNHVKNAIDQQIKKFNIGNPFSVSLVVGNILPFMGIMDINITSPTIPLIMQSNEICHPGNHTITVAKWGG